jgi:hypothetical protein
MATFNAIFAKVPISASAGFPNSEIWIQGPEPYATKIADASEAAFPGNVVNGLQLDTWYDIYAKNTSNVASGFSYIFATGNFGTFPVTPCCGNPVTYHIWNAVNFLDDVGPVGRNTAGGFHYSSANAQIPAGGTKWLMSVHVVAPTNTVKPANPVPVPPEGGGGGGGGSGGWGFPFPFPWPDLSFMTTEMWLIAGAAVVGVVVLAPVAGGGGDD